MLSGVEHPAKTKALIGAASGYLLETYDFAIYLVLRDIYSGSIFSGE